MCVCVCSAGRYRPGGQPETRGAKRDEPPPLAPARLVSLLWPFLVVQQLALMSQPTPLAAGAAGGPPPTAADDPVAAERVHAIMRSLCHLAPSLPASYFTARSMATDVLPRADRVDAWFVGHRALRPEDSLEMRRVMAAAGIRHLPAEGSGGGSGDDNSVTHDHEVEHPNAAAAAADAADAADAAAAAASKLPTPRLRANDAEVLASAAHASRSRVLNLARPGLLLREGLLCDADGCQLGAGVCCNGVCCSETGFLSCFRRDASRHTLLPSGKRCVLVRVAGSAVAGSAAAGSAADSAAACSAAGSAAAGSAAGSAAAGSAASSSGLAAAGGVRNTPALVIRALHVDEFVLQAAPGTVFVDEADISQRPLPAPEASVCTRCGSSHSLPHEWDVHAPFKRVDVGQTYSVAHVVKWSCGAKRAGGVCGNVWGRDSSTPVLVGVSALTPNRTHAVVSDGVLDAHVRQHAAAAHGQPVEELCRVVGASETPRLPLASLRRWTWVHVMWQVHVWGWLLGSMHACIVCGPSPLAVFVDGCFSASRRDTPGGWSSSGWSVAGSTALDSGVHDRLDAFDRVVHADGASSTHSVAAASGRLAQ